MKKIRCAIYTRKSSEEGLEQEFNSLHAQREACASYIASQKHEGWVLLPDQYDDGGISGGTLEREALRRLLRDVDEGLVDQIVGYKIDRLTRSLADFARLVERLDAADASFVSVTQTFNTATSMGRLTLNVLLSFAQFEREVTAERIRDKIAASKKKGLWMGGNVPLGYEADGRSLKIREDEAKTIRTIYDLYLRQKSVIAVTRRAERIGLRRRTDASGEAKPFGRGHIHYILTNPVYAGRIRHRDQVHEGQHEPIIDARIWDEVQTMLKEQSGRRRGDLQSSKTSLLAGKLFDETGDRLTPSHASKKGRRYRYYVSNRLIVDHKSEGFERATAGWRLPASELEAQLADAVLNHLCDHFTTGLLQELSAEEIERAGRLLGERTSPISVPDQRTILDCIARADIAAGKVQIDVEANAVANLLGLALSSINPEVLRFIIPFQLRKRGVESRLILGNLQSRTLDDTVIRSIAKAHQYYDAIRAGQTFDQIAKSENLSKRRILQVIDLAFLAPDIVKSVIQGNQPVSMTAKWLGQNPLPFDWETQREIIARL